MIFKLSSDSELGAGRFVGGMRDGIPYLLIRVYDTVTPYQVWYHDADVTRLVKCIQKQPEGCATDYTLGFGLLAFFRRFDEAA